MFATLILAALLLPLLLGALFQVWLGDTSPEAPPVAAPMRPVSASEPPDDPSAFWRYADWESGPIEQPFWMRPPKLPPRKVDVIDVRSDKMQQMSLLQQVLMQQGQSSSLAQQFYNSSSGYGGYGGMMNPIGLGSLFGRY